MQSELLIPWISARSVQVTLFYYIYCKDDLLFRVDFYDSQESSFDRMDGLYLELFDVTRIHVLRSMI